MKLLNKTSTYYLLFALPVFVICSGLIYYFISSEIKDELDESLWKEKIEVEQKLKNGADTKYISDEETIIESYPSKKIPFEFRFSDSAIYDDQEKEMLPLRVLTSYVSVKDQNFKIILEHSELESEDLIYGIVIPVLILFLVLLAGILFINYRISKNVWKPFYATLDKLRAFELNSNKDLLFAQERVMEFDELNRSLNIMLNRIHSDYLKQKEFTENASHEIQTPLAIIINKIELLIQSKQLGEEEMKLISGVYDAALKLSHLNKTLLLLTKIENDQFSKGQSISLKNVINKALDIYQPQADQKNIHIKLNVINDGTIIMNEALCEILFNNLISNSIRHNYENGNIEIILNGNQFIISNTGNPIAGTSETLFERFKKETSSSESIGLGLSLVKTICDKMHFTILHSFTNNIHTFILSW